jgi:hypothetical protein
MDEYVFPSLIIFVSNLICRMPTTSDSSNRNLRNLIIQKECSVVSGDISVSTKLAQIQST